MSTSVLAGIGGIWLGMSVLIAWGFSRWQRIQRDKVCPHGWVDWDHCPDCRH